MEGKGRKNALLALFQFGGTMFFLTLRAQAHEVPFLEDSLDPFSFTWSIPTHL